jgi:hypothetical protein
VIEFIGASSVSATGTSPIYHCSAGYAWLTAERLGADHRTISFSGKTLQDRPAYPAPTEVGATPSMKAGMDFLFFQNQPAEAHPGPAGLNEWHGWSGVNNPPADVVVCQVGGSNDCATTITPGAFSDLVVSFVRKLRGVYPQAHIFLLTPWYTFSDRSRALVTAVENAATSLRRGSDGLRPDDKVLFVDATGWLMLGSDDFCSDKGHPSNLGHRKAATHLSEVISPITGIPLVAEVRSVIQLNHDSVSIDDADDRFVWLGSYTPAVQGWQVVSSNESYRGGYRLSVASDSAFTYTFTGTFVRIHGPMLPGCSSDVVVTIKTQIDDGSWVVQQGSFSQHDTIPRSSQLLYESPPLLLSKNGRHTLSFYAKDGKPIAFDRLEVGSR